MSSSADDILEDQQAGLFAVGRRASSRKTRVREGAVEVTGVVHTWWEKEAVLGAVRGTRACGRLSIG